MAAQRNVRLTLAYDGTRYAGFQRQPNGVAVQEKLEEALRAVTSVPDLSIAAAAGRTDAGVHARGQVVNFFTDSRVPVDRWPHALNSHLPEDIVVWEAQEASPDFHARFSATGKRYRYSIHHAPFPSPIGRFYAYHHARPELDVQAMRQAADLLTGRHDFAAFRSTGGAAKTSERTVTQLQVAVEGPLLYIDIAADGFLYNMVRIIAGTLLEVGTGKRTLDQVREALATGKRNLAGRTLPPHGLCLEEVFYPAQPTRHKA